MNTILSDDLESMVLSLFVLFRNLPDTRPRLLLGEIEHDLPVIRVETCPRDKSGKRTVSIEHGQGPGIAVLELVHDDRHRLVRAQYDPGMLHQVGGTELAG